MPIVRKTRSDSMPPRWLKVITLLRQQAMTINELAKALKVNPRTARTYLSEATKNIEVIAEGPWRHTRYHIEEENISHDT